MRLEQAVKWYLFRSIYRHECLTVPYATGILIMCGVLALCGVAWSTIVVGCLVCETIQVIHILVRAVIVDGIARRHELDAKVAVTYAQVWFDVRAKVQSIFRPSTWYPTTDLETFVVEQMSRPPRATVDRLYPPKSPRSGNVR